MLDISFLLDHLSTPQDDGLQEARAELLQVREKVFRFSKAELFSDSELSTLSGVGGRGKGD